MILFNEKYIRPPEAGDLVIVTWDSGEKELGFFRRRIYSGNEGLIVFAGRGAERVPLEYIRRVETVNGEIFP